MSKKRISPEVGYVNPKKLPVGPNGRPLCRKCGCEVPVGRRTFCSEECVHDHRVRTDPGYVRQQVFARDRGVCALCGIDTVVTEQQLAKKTNVAKSVGYDHHCLDAIKHRREATESAQKEFKDKLGASLGARRTAGYWDADHTIPVVLDGGECGLANYRTLCIVCHKKETAELRKKIAAERRKAKETSC